MRKEQGIGKREANTRLVTSMAFLTDARPNGNKFHDNKDGPGDAVINLARFMTSRSTLLKNKLTFTRGGG